MVLAQTSYIDSGYMLNLTGAPVANNQASTKAYVDAVAVGGAALRFVVTEPWVTAP